MSQLIPCPSCNRHVRKTESSCPFCATSLALAGVPDAPLPRNRLGRAATFAFGATLAGAAALVGCGSDDEGKEGGGGAGAGGTASTAGTSSGNGGSGTVGPVYGAPAAGTGGDVSSSGSSNQGGSAQALYGAPPMSGSAGSEAETAGTGNFPVYGAAPADK
jgi:hypothetical protein